MLIKRFLKQIHWTTLQRAAEISPLVTARTIGPDLAIAGVKSGTKDDECSIDTLFSAFSSPNTLNSSGKHQRSPKAIINSCQLSTNSSSNGKSSPKATKSNLTETIIIGQVR